MDHWLRLRATDKVNIWIKIYNFNDEFIDMLNLKTTKKLYFMTKPSLEYTN